MSRKHFLSLRKVLFILKHYPIKTIIKTIIITFSISQSVCYVYAQGVYQTPFYTTIQKHYAHPGELKGHSFFSLRLTTDKGRNVVKHEFSSNVDSLVKIKMLKILSQLDFTTLKPFLLPSSQALLPFIDIYEANDPKLNREEKLQGLWNFSNNSKIPNKYQVLPPIIINNYVGSNPIVN